MAIVASQSAPAAAIRPAAVAAWIGLGIFWCGIALRLWSFRTLGRYFTVTVQTSGDQPVITSGPYRAIRHPSYAGILLAVVGLGLFIGNWWSLISLTAAVACGLVFRIRVEERALLQDLGPDYRTTTRLPTSGSCPLSGDGLRRAEASFTRSDVAPCAQRAIALARH